MQNDNHYSPETDYGTHPHKLIKRKGFQTDTIESQDFFFLSSGHWRNKWISNQKQPAALP